jgi:hypothetical protein
MSMGCQPWYKKKKIKTNLPIIPWTRGLGGGENSISYNTTLNFQSYLSTNYTNVCVSCSNYDKCKQGVPLKKRAH